MKSQITIRVNAETQEKINPFKDKPGKGYIILEQSQVDYYMGWANVEIRACTLKETLRCLNRLSTHPSEER